MVYGVCGMEYREGALKEGLLRLEEYVKVFVSQQGEQGQEVHHIRKLQMTITTDDH